MSLPKSPETDMLFQAVLSLKDEKECYAFFEDICTMKEIRDLSQRLQVALLLSKGIIFTEISAKTGASSATISRVNRSLNYGPGGYDIVIKRLLDNSGDIVDISGDNSG